MGVLLGAATPEAVREALDAALAGRDVGVQAYPAALLLRANAADLLERVTAAGGALDPSIFDEHAPVFWAAQISSNRLDSYFTRMDVSSLKNYAAEAEAGVAFQDSHLVFGAERALGYSVAARYAGPQGDGIAHVDADFYTLPTLSPAIEAWWRMVRAGLRRDVSIGFHGGAFRCSICGRDMLRDWDCWHFPGFEYELRDDEGHKTGKKAVAEASIEDAHLSEVSSVYDGATPSAAILKAYREVEAGRVRGAALELLGARYRIALRAPGRPLAAPAIPSEEETMAGKNGRASRARSAEDEEPKDPPAAQPEDDDADEEEGADAEAEGAGAGEEPATQDTERALRAVLAEHQVPVGKDGPLSAVRGLCAEVARMRPLAKEGEDHRRATIDAALDEGVRARGNSFDRAGWETRLAGLPTPEIRAFGEEWAAAAARDLKGGRQTAEEVEAPHPATNGARARFAPAAYRG